MSKEGGNCGTRGATTIAEGVGAFDIGVNAILAGVGVGMGTFEFAEHDPEHVSSPLALTVAQFDLLSFVEESFVLFTVNALWESKVPVSVESDFDSSFGLILRYG